MDNEYKRGSEWNKCDLHLHSFYTSINNNFKLSSVDDYLEKIKVSNIKILGLTNYFNFSDDDWNLKQKLEDNGIVSFLNLELRLTYTNKEDDCCDLHLIFSNDISKDDVNTFLTKLNCSVNGSHKTLISLNDNDKKTAVVEFDSIMKVLRDETLSGIKNKILIGMLSRGKGNSRSSSVYELITKDVNFIIHSSDKVKNIEDDVKYWHGNDANKPIESKALFQSSDSHKIEDIGKKYTWVKGIPCFETIRQSVIDYENRILIQERNPSDSKNASLNLFIDRVEYCLDDCTEVLYFNKDINSIIGKRGAGKSVLLKHIAYNSGVIESSEIKKLKKFKLHWCDNVNNDKFVEYISQNYLSSITYEDGEKYEERDKKLRELLFNSDLFKNAEENKVEIINSTELKISSNIKDVLKINRQILDTEIQLKSLGKEEDKENAIKLKQLEMDKFGKIDITDDDINNKTKYFTSLDKINKEVDLINQDIQIISKIKDIEKINFITIEDDIFTGLSQATFDLINNHIKGLSDNDVKNFLSNTLSNLKQDIKNKITEKENFEKLLKPIDEKLQKNKTIEVILKEIGKLTVEKEVISKYNKFIESSIKDKNVLIDNTISLYMSFKDRISSVIETLKDEFDGFTFITFDFKIGYNIKSYEKDFFDNFIDGRSGDVFKEYIKNEMDFNEYELKGIVQKIISNEVKIKASVNIENTLLALFRCRYDIDFTKSVKYKDIDNDCLIDFENMTGGQKAMALLDLIFNLSKSNFPIIIDQPENDIDVSGVSSDLRRLILQQKERRQVIIATHSPNLLLLVDSENVIIAKNEINEIKYQNSGIEDKYIQESIIDIMEGGMDALKKRMNKLNIDSN